MRINQVVLFVFVIFSLQMISCKKKTTDPFNSNFQNMMRENALIEAAFDDVLKVSENIMINNGDARMATTAAPLGCISDIDTVVTGLNQKTYTIHFVLGCSDYDGKARSGDIIIELNGSSYNAAGSVLTFRFNNYYINSNNLQGKMILTNEGNGVFKVVVADETGESYATMYLVGLGKNTKWKSTQKRTIVQGNGDNILLDNRYHISAYDATNVFVGITTDNFYYTGNISNYLVLDYSCNAYGNLRYPTYGILNYKLSETPRDVDYGDSTICDYAVIVRNGSDSTVFSLY